MRSGCVRTRRAHTYTHTHERTFLIEPSFTRSHSVLISSVFSIQYASSERISKFGFGAKAFPRDVSAS